MDLFRDGYAVVRNVVPDELVNRLKREASQLADYPEEAAVEMSPNDVLFIDARLLHSTYANMTDENRLAVNLWHIPQPSTLSVQTRRFISDNSEWLRRSFPPEMVLMEGSGEKATVGIETYMPKRHHLT